MSVILPCRNGLPFLSEALDSLRAQTYRKWELLFVDGGSTDGSVDAAVSAVPEARVIRAPDAPPAGVARNRAAEVAEGVLLAFLDSDDRWHPEKLERQVDAMAGSEADLVFSDCRVVDRNGNVLGLYLSRHRPARGRVFEPLTRGNFIPLSTIVVTRELFASSGGFPDAPKVAGDYAWLLRAARLARFDYLNEPLADYRITPGSLTEDFRRSYSENVELFERLASAETDPETKKLLEQALALVLCRWSLREALEGPARWPGAARLLGRTLGAAGGPLSGVTTLLDVLREAGRGLGLRRRMLRARRA